MLFELIQIRSGDYVFCTVVGGKYGDYADTAPISTFNETEGLTLVITEAKAIEHKLSYDGVFSCLTLQVNSSLAAVGLTAAVANALKDSGISANVIAAYHHDHVFVPKEKTIEALAALNLLSGGGES